MRSTVLLALSFALSGCFLSHVAGEASSGDRPPSPSEDLGPGDDAAPATIDAGLRRCGGDTAGACGPHEYCDFPPGDECGGADGPGVCRPAPWGCPALPRDPVCGCDGITYDDFCIPITRGISIASHGPCDCRTVPCPSGQRCEPCWGSYVCVGPDGDC